MLSLAPAILGLAATALADVSAQGLDGKYTCVGTFIFGRHNDRIAKPATVLTTLGARRQAVSGNFYRERYIGLSGDNTKTDSDFIIEGIQDDGVYQYGETYAQCPASTVIEYSQLSFLQGLYPATDAVNSNDTLSDSMQAALANGTEVTAPYDGYQYVFMDVQTETSENYFWIKGDENCPSSDEAIADWKKSDYFKKMNESTYDFYQNLSSTLPAKQFPKKKLSFANAMNIFDFMNVNRIHQEEYADLWSEETFHQVATLADKAQWGISYDESDPLANFTIGGQSILGAVYTYLNTTKVEGSPYINYFTGSFNNMYQLNGLLKLNQISANFTGMPDYGCTYVWDLLEDKSGKYYVMFSFKNGTDDNDVLTTYPMFGGKETVISWDDFEKSITKISITSLEQWCSSCSGNTSICDRFSSAYTYGTEVEDDGVSLSDLASGKTKVTKKGGLSLAGAGGIGAGVTIGVAAILAGLAYLFFKNKKKGTTTAAAATTSTTATGTAASRPAANTAAATTTTGAAGNSQHSHNGSVTTGTSASSDIEKVSNPENMV